MKSSDQIYDKVLETLSNALDNKADTADAMSCNVAIQLFQPLMTTIFFQRFQSGWKEILDDKEG